MSSVICRFLIDFMLLSSQKPDPAVFHFGRREGSQNLLFLHLFECSTIKLQSSLIQAKEHTRAHWHIEHWQMKRRTLGGWLCWKGKHLDEEDRGWRKRGWCTGWWRWSDYVSSIKMSNFCDRKPLLSAFVAERSLTICPDLWVIIFIAGAHPGSTCVTSGGSDL